MLRLFRNIVVVLFACLLLAIAIFLLIPSPIDAAAWTPSTPPPLEGTLALNDGLVSAELLAPGQILNPEDVAFDADGNLYTGSIDGTVYRMTFDANDAVASVEPFAFTDGYPLGLHFDASGNLIVATKDVGLHSISPDGAVTVLTDSAENVPITYADELDIAADGTIYFSDASTKWDWGWPYDVLEARPYGRLIAYDPATNETTVLVDEMYFANGILLAPDDSYVLIAETPRHRIQKLWLTGDNRGELELFADGLPVSPDNISWDSKNRIWIGGGLRPAALDSMAERPFVREQFAKLGFDYLRGLGTSNPYGFVMWLNEDGSIGGGLHDESGRVFGVSSAEQHKNHLYLGSLFGDAIARIPLP